MTYVEKNIHFRDTESACLFLEAARAPNADVPKAVSAGIEYVKKQLKSLFERVLSTAWQGEWKEFRSEKMKNQAKQEKQTAKN